MFTMFEVPERRGEHARTQVAEGADDVTPHVDEEGVVRSQIVAQSEPNDDSSRRRRSVSLTMKWAPQRFLDALAVGRDRRRADCSMRLRL
jgi:hypothetical protein